MQRGIGVAAADHATDTLPLEAIRLGEHRAERQCTGWLGLQIGQSEEESDTFLDLLFGHLDYGGKNLARNIPTSRTRPPHAGALASRGGHSPIPPDPAGAA